MVNEWENFENWKCLAQAEHAPKNVSTESILKQYFTHAEDAAQKFLRMLS